jgi:hypothetical protein
MWAWMIGGYAIVLVALTGCAGYVALFVTNQRRGERAYRILKMLLTAVTSSGGLVAVLVRLHQVGLL